MRRTTRPLPWRGSRRTMAPADGCRLRRCGRSNCCRRRRRWPGQRGAEVAHHLADRGFLVVAGHQHRDPAAARRYRRVRCRAGSCSQHGASLRRSRHKARLSHLRTRTCRLTIAFLLSLRPLCGNPERSRGRRHPIQSSPSPPSIAWSSWSTPDMERVNAPILARTGSRGDDDPGGRQPSDLVGRQAAAADADRGDGAA